MRQPVLVKPRSRRTEVGGSHGGVLVVRVREPAIDGRANQAVVTAVAGALGMPKMSVRIVRGSSSRHKLIEADGDDEALEAAWALLVSGGDG